MGFPERILVVGTAYGGGNWPPLAVVAVNLHQAGHAERCFGDPSIAQDLASAAIAVDVVPEEGALGTFIAQWRASSYRRRGRFEACDGRENADLSHPQTDWPQEVVVQLGDLCVLAAALLPCNTPSPSGPEAGRRFGGVLTGPAVGRMKASLPRQPQQLVTGTSPRSRCLCSADLGCTKIHDTSGQPPETNSRPRPLSARYRGWRSTRGGAICRS